MLYIPFTVRGDYKKVLLDDIIYINSERRKIFIHTVSEEFSFYGNIKSVIPWLDDRFYKCHGGLIVNFVKINEFEEQRIIFLNGDSVQIGIHNLRLTKKQYRAYMEKIAYLILHRQKPLRVSDN